MSPLLKQILQELVQLSAEEQLEVIAQATEHLKRRSVAKPQRKWSDLKGMVAYPMTGEDAQDWMSRSRRENDEYRERLLRGNA